MKLLQLYVSLNTGFTQKLSSITLMKDKLILNLHRDSYTHVFQSFRHIHGKRVLVVTNTTVAPLYLDKVVHALTVGNPNVTVESVILPDGEKYKDMVGFFFIPHLHLWLSSV